MLSYKYIEARKGLRTELTLSVVKVAKPKQLTKIDAVNKTLRLTLIIEATMTKTFKIRVGNLVAKFFAHTNVIFRFLDTAGAIPVFFL